MYISQIGIYSHIKLGRVNSTFSPKVCCSLKLIEKSYTFVELEEGSLSCWILIKATRTQNTMIIKKPTRKHQQPSVRLEQPEMSTFRKILKSEKIFVTWIL